MEALPNPLRRALLIAAVAACGSAAAADGSTTAKKAPAPVADPASPYHPDRFAGKAGRYYRMVWGIDEISVKLAESGELVRFGYRVLDPAKAALLNDKRNEASLVDPRARVSLVVPTMEKVGQLRQTAPPESGRSYWMTFSNKGGKVKRGDRVDVAIGTFHASNLVVD